MQQHGRNFEHDLVNGLATITPEEVWVSTTGYSGNDNTTACDFVVTVDPKLATRHEPIQVNGEAKKRQAEGGKRHSAVFGGSKGGETGLEELQRFVLTCPPWADPVIALKFDRRKLVVVDARWLLHELDDSLGQAPPPSAENLVETLAPRCTASENISMVKPTVDEWESSRAAQDDAVVLADKLGLPHDTEVSD